MYHYNAMHIARKILQLDQLPMEDFKVWALIKFIREVIACDLANFC